MKNNSSEIQQKLRNLEEKYSAIGQDMSGYLDGLLYAKTLTYWDYINLDALLSLQKPRTDFEDEIIFITYHQMSELMYSLILRECKNLCQEPVQDYSHWEKHLTRLIRYYRHMVSSFDIMTEGMDKEEFTKFRMALLPSSGFQSVQYRKVEIYSTNLNNLVHAKQREEYLKQTDLEKVYSALYWKSSNIELKTGQKTLTLKQFEDQYDESLLKLANDLQSKNIYARYLALPKTLREDQKLIKLLRTYDQYVNLFWPLVHYGAANHFLFQEHEILVATGGTNWQEYLPPNHQKIIFFPSVWEVEEQEHWGETQKASSPPKA